MGRVALTKIIRPKDILKIFKLRQLYRENRKALIPVFGPVKTIPQMTGSIVTNYNT